MLEHLTDVSTTFFYSIDGDMSLKTLAGLSTFFLECVHINWITNRGNMKCRLPNVFRLLPLSAFISWQPINLLLYIVH